MPRGDGTGPAGQGSMTGRGMGYCAGFNTPGFMNSGFGREFGRGFGRGRGFGWRARVIQPMPIQQVQPAVITEKQEKQFLEQELNALKEGMKEIEKRLKELKD
jgi:hypothetical protein